MSNDLHELLVLAWNGIRIVAAISALFFFCKGIQVTFYPGYVLGW